MKRAAESKEFRVWIADDVHDQLVGLRTHLDAIPPEAWGGSIAFKMFTTTAELLEEMKVVRPQVIVADIMMPRAESGALAIIEMLERESGILPKPLIMVTSNDGGAFASLAGKNHDWVKTNRKPLDLPKTKTSTMALTPEHEWRAIVLRAIRLHREGEHKARSREVWNVDELDLNQAPAWTSFITRLETITRLEPRPSSTLYVVRGGSSYYDREAVARAIAGSKKFQKTIYLCGHGIDGRTFAADVFGSEAASGFRNCSGSPGIGGLHNVREGGYLFIDGEELENVLPALYPPLGRLLSGEPRILRRMGAENEDGDGEFSGCVIVGLSSGQTLPSSIRASTIDLPEVAALGDQVVALAEGFLRQRERASSAFVKDHFLASSTKDALIAAGASLTWEQLWVLAGEWAASLAKEIRWSPANDLPPVIPGETWKLEIDLPKNTLTLSIDGQPYPKPLTIDHRKRWMAMLLAMSKADPMAEKEEKSKQFLKKWPDCFNSLNLTHKPELDKGKAHAMARTLWKWFEDEKEPWSKIREKAGGINRQGFFDWKKDRVEVSVVNPSS